MKFFAVLIFCAGLLFGSTVEQIQVTQPLDGKPFTCMMKLERSLSRCDQYSFRFPSAIQSGKNLPQDTVTGELFRARNVPQTHRFPAVIVYHVIAPLDFTLERTMCQTLADNGITSLFFHLPYFGSRRNPGESSSTALMSLTVFTKCLEQAVSDSKRAVDFLCTLPEIARDKIGACGVSLGSLMTANALGTDQRIQRGMMILGGGDLWAIIHNNCWETASFRSLLSKLSPEGQENMKCELEKVDPLRYSEVLTGLGERFCMINASNDHVIPPACSQKLANAVGTRIIWIPNTNHYTAFSELGSILQRLVEFFRKDRPTWGAPNSQMRLADSLLSSLCRGALAFCGVRRPMDGCMHRMRGELSVRIVKGFELTMQFDYALGTGNRFYFNCVSPLVRFRVGQSDAGPWFIGMKGEKSEMNPAVPRKLDPLWKFINKNYYNELQMLEAALAFAAAAPEQLNSVVDRSITIDGDKKTLHVKSRMADYPLELVASFGKASILRSISANVNNLKVAIRLKEWSVNIKEKTALFASPVTKTKTKLLNPPEHPFKEFIKAIELLLNMFN